MYIESRGEYNLYKRISPHIECNTTMSSTMLHFVIKYSKIE